ncbi:T-box protein VegT-like [Rhinophrynus dorsalis]
MILTKNGRRMFPELSVSLSGLDPYGLYALCVQAVPEGDTRYKWRDGGWTKSGKAEAGPPTRLYMHPESPAPGHRWMDRPVCFSKIRLTNNTLSQGGQIVLQSMHRYSLRLYIIPAAGHGTHSCVSFPETAFIAVTSYQNSRLSLLKIEENPFAKGIKYFKNQMENHSPRKRINRSEQSEDTSPGCKKFKEGAEDEHSVTEETEEEGEEELCVTDESPEREKKRRTVIDESPVPREDRHSAKSADKLGRREETPLGLVLAMPKAVDHCGPTSQRQAWLSPPPPAVPQLPMPSYSQSPCLIGHRSVPGAAVL